MKKVLLTHTSLFGGSPSSQKSYGGHGDEMAMVVVGQLVILNRALPRNGLRMSGNA